MRKMRFIAMLVILGMLLSIISACSLQTTPAATTAVTTAAATEATVEPKKTNEFGWVIPDKTLEITVYDANGSYAPSEESKQGRTNMEKYLLDNFNVKFTMQTTDGDGTENLNLMLASGNYPPIIFNATYEAVLKMKGLGKAQDLTAAIDKVGADIKKDIGDLYPLFLDSSNKLWYVPIGVGALMELPDYSAHVRWDEYTAIGSPEIKTPDDYYSTIKKILAKFPKTPAGENRYALSLYNQGDPAGSFGGYWGLKKGWKVAKDNTLTYWAFTEEGKAMTKWFNRFWTDGTMDPDSFVNNFDQWKAKFSNEKIVGAIGGWWIAYNAGHEVWMLTDPNLPADKRFVQVGFKAPEAEAAYVTGKNKYGWANTIITDKCTNVEDVMTFINFQATERGLALFGWGIPNGVANFKDPSKQVKLWSIDKSGKWTFDPTAKQQFVTETWDYPAEGVVYSGMLQLFTHCNRWPDGEHCIWGNQMWYSENKWKSMMIKNMDGTIYDFTPMVLREKDEATILTETAITDAYKQNWPLVVQSKSAGEFDKNWKALQDALTAVGIVEYTKKTQDNFAANLAKLK
jgi:putative aldouronate transport system substrate-binding protein